MYNCSQLYWLHLGTYQFNLKSLVCLVQMCWSGELLLFSACHLKEDFSNKFVIIFNLCSCFRWATNSLFLRCWVWPRFMVKLHALIPYSLNQTYMKHPVLFPSMSLFRLLSSCCIRIIYHRRHPLTSLCLKRIKQHPFT